MPFGPSNFSRTTSVLTFSMVIGLPLTTHSGGGAGVMLVSSAMSSHQKMMSSVVNGSPSDHFRPLRNVSVSCLPSGAELPLLGQARADLALRVARPAQDRLVDVAPIGVEVGDALEGRPPGAAVLADLLDRLDHQRVLGQALLDRRQLAGLDHLRPSAALPCRRRLGGSGRRPGGGRWLRGFGRLRGLGRLGGSGGAGQAAAVGAASAGFASRLRGGRSGWPAGSGYRRRPAGRPRARTGRRAAGGVGSCGPRAMRSGVREARVRASPCHGPPLSRRSDRRRKGMDAVTASASGNVVG